MDEARAVKLLWRHFRPQDHFISSLNITTSHRHKFLASTGQKLWHHFRSVWTCHQKGRYYDVTPINHNVSKCAHQLNDLGGSSSNKPLHPIPGQLSEKLLPYQLPTCNVHLLSLSHRKASSYLVFLGHRRKDVNNATRNYTNIHTIFMRS